MGVKKCYIQCKKKKKKRIYKLQMYFTLKRILTNISFVKMWNGCSRFCAICKCIIEKQKLYFITSCFQRLPNTWPKGKKSTVSALSLQGLTHLENLQRVFSGIYIAVYSFSGPLAVFRNGVNVNSVGCQSLNIHAFHSLTASRGAVIVYSQSVNQSSSVRLLFF